MLIQLFDILAEHLATYAAWTGGISLPLLLLISFLRPARRRRLWYGLAAIAAAILVAGLVFSEGIAA